MYSLVYRRRSLAWFGNPRELWPGHHSRRVRWHCSARRRRHNQGGPSIRDEIRPIWRHRPMTFRQANKPHTLAHVLYYNILYYKCAVCMCVWCSICILFIKTDLCKTFAKSVFFLSQIVDDDDGYFFTLNRSCLLYSGNPVVGRFNI